MKIEKNTVVSIHYSLTDNDGTVLDSSINHEPLQYVHGSGGIIPGLEKALESKTKGEKFKVTVGPEEAYGERDESLVQKIPKSQFQGIDEVKVGMQFEVKTQEETHMIVSVVGVDDSEVTVDGNHPLASTTLNFDVEVTEVRKATEEEVKHGHVCAGGCSC